MNVSYYGHALYYPYIHLSKENWLKVAALYYDGLSRIVPKNFQPKDSDFVKALINEFDFVKNLDPGYEAEQIAESFLEFAHKELANPKNRRQMFKDIQGSLLPNSSFRIHFEKMAFALRKELPRLGLAKRSLLPSTLRRRYDDWYEFEPVTGAIYMSFLANRMAEVRALPIVSDHAIFQALINRSQFDKWSDPDDKGHALASLVIETSIPENLEAVSLKQIIHFRRKHDSERLRFYEGIRSLAKDIPKVQDKQALDECLHHHKKNIELAVEDLNLSLKGVGISCGTALVGLSVPSWASKLAEKEPSFGVQIATAGVVTAALANLVKEGINYYKSRRNSPWSYILSLRKGISHENFLKSLMNGRIIL